MLGLGRIVTVNRARFSSTEIFERLSISSFELVSTQQSILSSTEVSPLSHFWG